MSNPRVSLPDVIKQLFQRKGLDDDILINLKDGSKLNVYAPIIISQSKVFEKMLTVDMKEKETKTVDMTAYDAVTVKRLFEYFYSHEFDCKTSQISEWFDFLDVLDMFELTNFYKDVEELMCSNCNTDNVFQIFTEYLGRMNKSQAIYEQVKKIVCASLIQIIKIENNPEMPNWRRHGYMCFDQIKPGTTKDGVVLRPKSYGAHMCCKHYKTDTKEYLKKPTAGLEHKGRYLCIAHTMDGSESSGCVTMFCCMHSANNGENNKLLADLKKQSEDVRSGVLNMLLNLE